MLTEFEYEYTDREVKKIQRLKEFIFYDKRWFVGFEEVFLTKFLNFANWNVSKSYKCLIDYYDFKRKHPEWFYKRPVDYFRRHFLETKTHFVMPYPDKNNRPILIIKSVNAFGDFPKFFRDIIEMDDLILEGMLLLPRTQKFGLTIIFDLNGMTYNFVRMLSPMFARLMNDKISVIPCRHLSVHVIHSGAIASTAIALILPFINNKYKRYINYHSGQNFEMLHKMLGYENVPADYKGPETNTLDENLLFNFLLSHRSYLERIARYHLRF